VNPDVMVAPDINYLAILPMLIVAAAAVLGVIVETFLGRGARRPVQLVLVFGSIAAAFAALIWQSGTRSLEVEGALAIEMAARARDLAETIHAHPTLGETGAFAAENHFGTATEIYRPRS
jgi:NADH:ubiquinone oxidoreductase subunit 2 (subunit N)